MSPTARSRYTLLIPTFNRPAYLRSLLSNLGTRAIDHECRIGAGAHIGPGIRLAGAINVG
jgi:acetyltransferase-like isoleucine patch superfamily enzyme